jgi:hypothetical protein
MAEPIVIAHLMSKQGTRVCNARDAATTVDFSPEAWAAHIRSDSSRSVIRCGRCAELLRRGAG